MTEVEPVPNRQTTHKKGIRIPEFGTVALIPAENFEGCVDPRRSLVFLPPIGDLANQISYNSNILRAPLYPGAERSPGASFGKAMSLAAAAPGLTAQEAVDYVREWEESEGRVFTIHQDDGKHGSGCGHIDRASEENTEGLYGPDLPSAKVREMRDYVMEKISNGDIMGYVPMLAGKHKEKAVLVVYSEDETVEASDGNEEFFRFDATRHDNSLRRLAEFVKTKKGQGDISNKLLEEATRQRNATLSRLAKGLPVYDINLKSHEPKVTLRSRRNRNDTGVKKKVRTDNAKKTHIHLGYKKAGIITPLYKEIIILTCITRN